MHFRAWLASLELLKNLWHVGHSVQLLTCCSKQLLPKTFLHFGHCGAVRVLSVLLPSVSLLVGEAADAWMSPASMCASG
jgi:hypothetical protein